jgi:hypothetical protein
MCEHALVAVDDALYGIIICEHREDGIAFTGLGQVFSRFGAECDQRLRPFLSSVVNCDGVTGLDEVGCHPAAHMSEANEANVHVSLLLLPSILAGYAASTRPNNTPIFLHATSRSLTLRVGNAARILQVRVADPPISKANPRQISPIHRATPSRPSGRACRSLQ